MSIPGLHAVAVALVVVVAVGGFAVLVVGYPVAIFGTLALIAAVVLLARAIVREMSPRRE